MSETVHNVTTLPAKPSAFKRWSKRTAIAALATTVVAAIYLKTQGNNEETVNETPQA